LGDQIKIEIVDAKANEGILRMYRAEDSTDPQLDWMYTVEASVWRHLLHQFGYTDVDVELIEMSKKYADFRIIKH
jgi:hypothetical protein